MKNKKYSCLLWAVYLTTVHLLSIGLAAHEFDLPSIKGGSVSLKSGSKPTIVYFMGTECPLAKLYSARLQKLANEHDGQIRLIGVSSNQQDSIDDLKAFVDKLDLHFEVAKDYQNKIANAYGATRTPEVFLLDKDLQIVYQGRIDDQYLPGVSRAKATQHYLKDAVKNLVNNEEIELKKTSPIGCLIGKVKSPKKDSRVTYCGQISRLLQKHCIECHRQGEIGPFSLTEYEEVVGWADMMLEVVDQNRMPPWHANKDHGDFVNTRHMTDQEKKLLADWVDAGSPYGNQNELPARKVFPSGWNLSREPDLVVEMKKAYPVPSQGVVDYQYFVVDPGFKEDKWIKEAQVLPGNRSVVHHSIVFVRPPDGKRSSGIGWLGAYVPGQRARILPKGAARFVPAKSKLVFQQHYTPNGNAEDDKTKVGLIFADSKDIQHEVFTLAGIDQDFVIPAGDSKYKLNVKFPPLPKHGELLSVTPHMHWRGKSFTARNVTDGSKKIICEVPAYDFNWQHSYVYRKPIPLSEIGRLDFEVVFDNSKDNPFNPNPNEDVTWGNQTFEEMAVVFFDISVPRNRTLRSTQPTIKKDTKADEIREEVLNFVDGFFKKFDKNKNGLVERDETPIALRGFGFWQYDENRDSKLTREEVTKARTRLKAK